MKIVKIIVVFVAIMMLLDPVSVYADEIECK